MFGDRKKEWRFVPKEVQGLGMGAVEILVDTVTGVNYLILQAPYGGITPLLDENGNVIIDMITKK